MSSYNKKNWKFTDKHGSNFEYTEESGAATVGALVGAAIAGPVGAAIGAGIATVIAVVSKDKKDK